MKRKKFDIDSLQVASPCSMSWEQMAGDERTRFCSFCSLNVYNISELTAKEVAELVAKTEGRFCARMYKRADGTVLTRDCPVGLRAYRKRVSRFAGAALTAVIGLFSGAFGQTEAKKDSESISAATLTIERIINKTSENALQGTVRNNKGEIVSGAEIVLRDAKGKFVFLTISDSNGTYGGRSISPGIYDIEISAAGFKKQEIKGLKINGREIAKLNITLTPLSQEAQELLGVTVVTMGAIQQLPLQQRDVLDLLTLVPLTPPADKPEKP